MSTMPRNDMCPVCVRAFDPEDVLVIFSEPGDSGLIHYDCYLYLARENKELTILAQGGIQNHSSCAICSTLFAQESDHVEYWEWQSKEKAVGPKWAHQNCLLSLSEKENREHPPV